MNIIKNIVYVTLGLLVAVAALQIPLQAQTCDKCAAPAAPACQPPPAECTVWVPQIVFENRTVTVARYRHETRERMVLVNRDVPVIKNIEEEYTVMVPQTRTRTVEDTINHPQYHDIVLRKTDMAPQIEARQSTRTVCRLVSFQEEKTVYDTVNQCDQNANATPPPTSQIAASPADPANPGGCTTCAQPACNTCTQVTVPRKITTTCTKPVNEQETVQYPVTRFQPSAQLQNVSYYEFQPEIVTHEEQYTVQVPEKRVRTRQVTEIRTVAEEKPEKYTVLVPYHEKVQVPCPVLRCVPERVALPAAPSCYTCRGG
jgi:hypothetical protein